MKLTVIGHLCSDVVHLPDGRERAGWGGILYAVGALANIAAEDDTIYPVFGAGRDDLEKVRRRLDRYPNVDTGGVFAFDGETNTVHLVYGEGGTRIECSRSIAPPIPFHRIEPFLAVNGVLVNMISGNDISLETLDDIRLMVRPRGTSIHVDLHSLTLGVEPNGDRFRRPVSDWRRWCFMVNAVQLNEEEAAGLTIEKYDEEALARQMLPLMVHAFCITRGERGVTVFRQEHKKVLRDDIPGVPVIRGAESTGCGDVFGAAFLYYFCKTRRAIEAASRANEVAAANAAAGGFESIDALARFRSAVM